MPDFTPPLETDPTRIVEDVYANPPLSTVPDHDSRDGFEDFLISRHEPEAGITPGGRVFIETGIDSITHLERDGWLFTPKAALVGALVLTGGVNLLLNTGNISNGVKDGISELEHVFETDQVCRTVHPSDEVIKRAEHQFDSFISLGGSEKIEPDEAQIQGLVSTLASLQSKTSKVTSLAIQARASDEWLSRQPGLGLGVADDGNAQLAPARLTAFEAAFIKESAAQGVKLDGVKTSFSEVELSATEIATVEEAVVAGGFTNVKTALHEFNADPTKLTPALRQVLQTYFGQNRGVNVEVKYETVKIEVKPGRPFEVCREVHPPAKHHKYDWDFIPIPLLPLPRLRKVLMDKVRGEWLDVPDQLPDPEFLKLYPEAEVRLGELGHEAWAYARKYQNLFRENDRIQGSYRLDYTDEAGEAQRLRAIFVDHTPTTESLEMVGGLFQTISQMQGGRVGQELDMVVIYPEDNAGLHGDPKKVGLGLDIQRKAGVQGVAYPGLRLVEMHMPARPTEAELNEFDGAKWVIAHEVAGHFTDLNDESNRISPLGQVDNKTVFAMNNRFADRAEQDFRRATREEAGNDTRTWWQKVLRRPYDTDLKWHIRRGTQMLSGETEFPREDVVKTTDPRLTETVFTRIGRFMSRYGRTHAAEHYAEAAANVATGIGAPFAEEPEARSNRVTARQGYASTYSASPSMHRLITDTWGSDPNADFAVFSGEAAARQQWKHWYGSLEDSDLYHLVEEARNHPLPDEADLLWILTGTRMKD